MSLMRCLNSPTDVKGTAGANREASRGAKNPTAGRTAAPRQGLQDAELKQVMTVAAWVRGNKVG